MVMCKKKTSALARLWNRRLRGRSARLSGWRHKLEGLEVYILVMQEFSNPLVWGGIGESRLVKISD
jgi:hypothetical protein